MATHERVFFSHTSISVIFRVLCTQQRHINIFRFLYVCCTLKMTLETTCSSTTFFLATALHTENQPIDDWGIEIELFLSLKLCLHA
jgi:hypothetical protein